MPSEELPGLLATFADAVERNDVEAAEQTLGRIESIYRAIDTTERIKQQKALTARDTTETETDTRERLDRFAQGVVATDLSRSGLLVSGALYIADPSQVPADRLADRARDLASQESNLIDLGRAVSDTLESMEFRPLVAITEADIVATEETVTEGDKPKGTPFGFSLRVRNVGDRGLEEITVSQEASVVEGITGSRGSEVPVSPDSVPLGSLEPDREASASFEVRPTSAGRYEITFTAASANADDDTRDVTFEVVNKAGATTNARTSLEDLIERIDESAEVTGETEQSVLSTLGNAAESLAEAQELIEQGSDEEANAALEESSGSLESFLDSLENSRPLLPSAEVSTWDASRAFTRGVANQTEGVIDQIALARMAQI